MVTFRLVIFTGSARERRQGSPEVGLKWERPRDTAKSRAEAVQTLRDRLAIDPDSKRRSSFPVFESVAGDLRLLADLLELKQPLIFPEETRGNEPCP